MNEGIGSKCENTVKQLYFMLGQLRILRSSVYLKRQLALDATPTAFIIAIVDSTTVVLCSTVDKINLKILIKV